MNYNELNDELRHTYVEISAKHSEFSIRGNDIW